MAVVVWWYGAGVIGGCGRPYSKMSWNWSTNLTPAVGPYTLHITENSFRHYLYWVGAKGSTNSTPLLDATSTTRIPPPGFSCPRKTKVEGMSLSLAAHGVQLSRLYGKAWALRLRQYRRRHTGGQRKGCCACDVHRGWAERRRAGRGVRRLTALASMRCVRSRLLVWWCWNRFFCRGDSWPYHCCGFCWCYQCLARWT